MTAVTAPAGPTLATLEFTDAWSAGPGRPQLAPHEVHLWRIPLVADAGGAVAGPAATAPGGELAEALGALSPSEAQRAASFLRPDDARQFAVTRAAVRSILGRYLGVAPAQVAFATARSGKPRALAPDGSPGPRYNSTHSGRLAVCAVAGAPVEVGVDLEWMRPAPIAAGIAAGIVSPDGPIRPDEPASIERDWAFFQYWTRTEAALKATGEGLSAIDRRPPEVLRALAELRTAAYLPGLRIVDVPIGLDAVAALAMIGAEHVTVARCWTWKPVALGRDTLVLDPGGMHG
jgi:4'-phosphopantetheinyl transferase